MDARMALISAIADLEEEKALQLVRRRLAAGEDPMAIIEDCQEGMRLVGLNYERQNYFLAGLIMGGEIFRQIMELVKPKIESNLCPGQVSGRILLGTVQGDIHDLGKNIVNMLLSCRKFTVCDLGVDVPPRVFLHAVEDVHPDIIGLSGLMTISYDYMRETVALLREHGHKMPVIIGGSLVNENICRYVGADYWANDAMRGIELCERLVAQSQNVP